MYIADTLETLAAKIVKCDTLLFDTPVSDEEIVWLGRFESDLGYRLVSHKGYAYQQFVKQFEHICKEQSISAIAPKVEGPMIFFGGRFADDATEQFDMIQGAEETISYMHPIYDHRWEREGASFIKYEALAEEGVAAMLLHGFVTYNNMVGMPNTLKAFIDELDIGFISADTSIGEEEIEALVSHIGERPCTLVVGRDLYEHPKAIQIATLLGYLHRYTTVRVICIPPYRNASGVIRSCRLCKDVLGRTFGYFTKADHMIDRQTLAQVGYEKKRVDEGVLLEQLYMLVSSYRSKTEVVREPQCEMETEAYCDLAGIEIEEMEPLDGTVIYLCDPASLDCDTYGETILLPLYASAQFARVAKVEDGMMIGFELDGMRYKRVLRIDTAIRGMIAISPTCDIDLSNSSVSLSRFRCITIEKEEKA